MESGPKRLVRSVWNGPFHIGKLSPPVSVGEVLLKIFETAWRFFIVVVSLLVAIALSLMAWTYVVGPTFFPPLKDQVSAKATFDDGSGPPPIVVGREGSEPKEPFSCNADFPLKIEFTNNSSTAVGWISFSIEGYAPGRTRNLIRDGVWREADAVIPAGYTRSSCWGIQLEEGFEANQLSYRVQITSAEEADPARENLETPAILPIPSPSQSAKKETATPSPTSEPHPSLATLRSGDWEKIGMGCSCSFTVGTPRQEKLIAGGDGLTFFRLNGKEFLCPAPDTQAMFDGPVSMSCGSAAVQVTPYGEVQPGFDGHSSNARLHLADTSGTLSLTGTWGCGC